MSIVEILEKKGRMELVELASLFAQNPTTMQNREETMIEIGEEECDNCIQDKQGSRLTSRIIMKPSEVD